MKLLLLLIPAFLIGCKQNPEVSLDKIDAFLDSPAEPANFQIVDRAGSIFKINPKTGETWAKCGDNWCHMTEAKNAINLDVVNKKAVEKERAASKKRMEELEASILAERRERFEREYAENLREREALRLEIARVAQEYNAARAQQQQSNSIRDLYYIQQMGRQIGQDVSNAIYPQNSVPSPSFQTTNCNSYYPNSMDCRTTSY